MLENVTLQLIPTTTPNEVMHFLNYNVMLICIELIILLPRSIHVFPVLMASPVSDTVLLSGGYYPAAKYLFLFIPVGSIWNSEQYSATYLFSFIQYIGRAIKKHILILVIPQYLSYMQAMSMLFKQLIFIFFSAMIPLL